MLATLIKAPHNSKASGCNQSLQLISNSKNIIQKEVRVASVDFQVKDNTAGLELEMSSSWLYVDRGTRVASLHGLQL